MSDPTTDRREHTVRIYFDQLWLLGAWPTTDTERLELVVDRLEGDYAITLDADDPFDVHHIEEVDFDEDGVAVSGWLQVDA